jgi:hypothetical protein
LFFKNDKILALENLKKHLILALLIFNITFWLAIASRKRLVTTIMAESFCSCQFCDVQVPKIDG